MRLVDIPASFFHTEKTVMVFWSGRKETFSCLFKTINKKVYYRYGIDNNFIPLHYSDCSIFPVKQFFKKPKQRI